MPTNSMCHVSLISKGALPFPKHKQKEFVLGVETEELGEAVAGGRGGRGN